MKIGILSTEAQAGLVKWAQHAHRDDLLFEAIGSLCTEWAWIWFQLRVADDRPEWFPRGKWATLQLIEAKLDQEAKQERDAR